MLKNIPFESSQVHLNNTVTGILDQCQPASQRRGDPTGADAIASLSNLTFEIICYVILPKHMIFKIIVLPLVLQGPEEGRAGSGAIFSLCCLLTLLACVLVNIYVHEMSCIGSGHFDNA